LLNIPFRLIERSNFLFFIIFILVSFEECNTPSIINGVIQSSQQQINAGTFLTIECTPGFVIEGRETLEIYCQENGQFTLGRTGPPTGSLRCRKG